MKIAGEAELNIEREQHKKTLMEVVKFNREKKELKHEIEQLQTKLILKERDVDDLKLRLDAKNTLEQRTNDRDFNLYQKNFGKQPNSAYDNKVVSLLKINENQKEILQQENQSLKLELETLIQKIRHLESESGTVKKDSYYDNERIQKEFI